jgi:hypothetical protein
MTDVAKRAQGAIKHTLLLLLIIPVVVRFQLREEEAEEEEDSPVTAVLLVCPHCQRQRVANGRRIGHCVGTVLHPHWATRMEIES